MVTPSECCGVAYCAAAAGIDTLISAAKTPRTPTRRRPFPASDEDRNSCELFAMKLNSPTSEILPGCSFMSAPATAPSPVKPFQDDSLILQPLSGRGRIQRGTLHAKMNTRADRLRLPPTDGKREKSLRARSALSAFVACGTDGCRCRVGALDFPASGSAGKSGNLMAR